MTVQELAERWNVHYNTVYKLVRAGALEGVKEGGRKTGGISISEEEVLRYEEQVGLPKKSDRITSEEVMELLECNRHSMMKYIELGMLKDSRIIDSNKSPMLFSKKQVMELRKIFNK